MGDLDLPDYIDEELLDADEDFDDERAGKRRKLEPEEEQRQLRERLYLEQRALQERQMQEQVRQHFLHYARQNGIAQQDQVEILDQLMSYPYEEQRAYINKMKERAEAVAMRLRQEAHLDAQRAERVAQLERHEAALEHQKAAEEGVVVVLGGGDAARRLEMRRAAALFHGSRACLRA